MQLPRVQRKIVPHEFVLEALSALDPVTPLMFGCTAVYVGEKNVLILRDGRARRKTTVSGLPLLGSGLTGWQILPMTAPDFEESALRACELILARDPRIGKVPKPRK